MQMTTPNTNTGTIPDPNLALTPEQVAAAASAEAARVSAEAAAAAAGGKTAEEIAAEAATAAAANTWFDGSDFNADAAKTLVVNLRSENKELAKAVADMSRKVEELSKGGNQGSEGGAQPKIETETDAGKEALRIALEMQNTMTQNIRRQRFNEVATAMNLRPEVVDMAYATVQGELQFADSGEPVNLTATVEALKGRMPILFAPLTQGQGAAGVTGGQTGGAVHGVVPPADEAAYAKAFGMTHEQYVASKTGQRPVAPTT